MLSEELVKVVNEALSVYHRTPIEQYPMARAVDRIEELTEPNSRERLEAFNILSHCVDQLEEINYKEHSA